MSRRRRGRELYEKEIGIMKKKDQEKIEKQTKKKQSEKRKEGEMETCKRM